MLHDRASVHLISACCMVVGKPSLANVPWVLLGNCYAPCVCVCYFLPVAGQEVCRSGACAEVAPKLGTLGGGQAHVMDPKGMCRSQGVQVVWNNDWWALDGVRRQCCPGAGCVCVCVCVCVCPPGDRWFLQVTNFRFVLVIPGNSGTRTGGAGRGAGLAEAQAVA